MPMTHIRIAVIAGRSSFTRDTRALSTEVSTSATMPIGCTTMMGAKRSAVSWKTIARPSMIVPNSQLGRASSRSSCPPDNPAFSPVPWAASTFSTPRCCSCAPSERNTAPTTAMRIPSQGIELTNASTSSLVGITSSTRRIYRSSPRYPGRMAVLPIRITGDPVLHTRAQEVEEIDEGLSALVHDMEDTMSAAPGVGLAAPQVGIPLRLFVYNWRDEEGVLHRGTAINPQLLISPPPIGEADDDEDSEGCLSIPGERFPL